MWLLYLISSVPTPLFGSVANVVIRVPVFTNLGHLGSIHRHAVAAINTAHRTARAVKKGHMDQNTVSAGLALVQMNGRNLISAAAQNPAVRTKRS